MEVICIKVSKLFLKSLRVVNSDGLEKILSIFLIRVDIKEF